MLNCSIWPIDRALSDATSSGLNGPEIDGNEGLLRIPQNSSITETSPLDCLVSYAGYSSREFYSSAKMQSVYSAAPADLAICQRIASVGYMVKEIKFIIT